MAKDNSLQSTLYIGREEQTSRLAVFINAQKGTVMDVQVPQSVSRWKPLELTAHCKLEIYRDGSLKLINLNPNNITMVDGKQIERAWIDTNSNVQLGFESFMLPLTQLLQKVGYKPVFKIDHLQGIYQDYQDKMVEMQLEQSKEASRQRLTGICSTLGMFIMLIPFENLFGYKSDGGMGLPMIIRMALLGIALIMSVSFYLKSRNPANSAVMKRMEINNWLKANYRCPNPECGEPFGPNTDYQRLKAQGQCPYCKCKLAETTAYVSHSRPGQPAYAY